MAPQPRRGGQQQPGRTTTPPKGQSAPPPAKKTAATQPERVALIQAVASLSAAVASDQERIASLEETVFQVARLAGMEKHPQVAAMLQTRHTARLVTADIDNPAQPIPAPPDVAPAPEMTSQEAIPPTATDNPTAPGASPLTDVAPEATTAPGQVGTVLDEPLTLNEIDVTAPVANTGPEAIPPQIETEVRVGNPDNPQVDQPWLLPGATSALAPEGANEGRFVASLRLARLRMQAGLVTASDDLSLAETISADTAITDEAMATETRTLAAVLTARQPVARTAASRHLVPQHAAGVQRTVPSLTSVAGLGPDIEDDGSCLFE